jgi:hypothetical protein
MILSQKRMIRNHLITEGSLTPLDCLKLYDCMRLGAIILMLRQDGMDIKTEMVYKNRKRYAKYIYEKK